MTALDDTFPVQCNEKATPRYIEEYMWWTSPVHKQTVGWKTGLKPQTGQQ